MEIFYEIKPGLLAASAVALGFFDGVHPGHQTVIKLAVASASKLGIPCVVATFRDHPRRLTSRQNPALLCTFEQRIEYFAKLGVDATLALEFTEELCQLSAQEYVKLVLIGCLGAHSISVGYNHRFGCNRSGTPELLSQLGPQLGFTVQVAPEVIIDGCELSSSNIRTALFNGNLHLANRLLGRPYELCATVMRGEGLGAKIGFPTANLIIPDNLLLPKPGVYAGKTRINNKLWNSVINIGYRPTVSVDNKLTVEVHIMNFTGDLYEKVLSVELLEYLRPEQKFVDMSALKLQIASDCRQAIQLLDHVSPSS